MTDLESSQKKKVFADTSENTFDSDQVHAQIKKKVIDAIQKIDQSPNSSPVTIGGKEYQVNIFSQEIFVDSPQELIFLLHAFNDQHPDVDVNNALDHEFMHLAKIASIYGIEDVKLGVSLSKDAQGKVHVHAINWFRAPETEEHQQQLLHILEITVAPLVNSDQTLSDLDESIIAQVLANLSVEAKQVAVEILRPALTNINFNTNLEALYESPIDHTKDSDALGFVDKQGFPRDYLMGMVRIDENKVSPEIMKQVDILVKKLRESDKVGVTGWRDVRMEIYAAYRPGLDPLPEGNMTHIVQNALNNARQSEAYRMKLTKEQQYGHSHSFAPLIQKLELALDLTQNP